MLSILVQKVFQILANNFKNAYYENTMHKFQFLHENKL